MSDDINDPINKEECDLDDDKHLNSPVPGRGKFCEYFWKIPKTIIVCSVMLVIGIVFIVLPFCISISKSLCIGMWICGGLFLIPSVYVTYILFNIINETPGFSLDGLPLWDNI